MKCPSTTRRRFLRASATGLLIVPAWVVGRGQQPPPSRRLNLAAIGAGGKGESDVEGVAPGNNIVALCDVDPSRAATSLKRFPDAKRYSDFRRMFDEMEKSIDAVTISTPDHMHFPAAMWAMRRGKHVLVQKPLTHSMWEARQLTLAAREHKVVSKMGNQGQASEDTRRLIEFLRGGAIGTVREIHYWTNRPIWPQGVARPADTPPVPANLDWPSWIGVAPERPYHPAYHPFKWRGWWDFGTGALGDIGCHTINPAFWALDEMKGAFSVEAETSPYNDETFPSWSIVTYRFPRPNGAPELKVVWYDGGKKPPRPPELEPERSFDEDNGVLYVGDKGTMLGNRLIPEAKMKEYLPNAPKPTMPRSPGHAEEWIAAIKGAPRVDNSFDHAGPLTEMVLAGNVAIRCKAKLEWNPSKLEFTNLPEANRWLRRGYRPGWEV